MRPPLSPWLTAVPGHRALTRVGSHEPYFIAPSPSPHSGFAGAFASLRIPSLETTPAKSSLTASAPPSQNTSASLRGVGQYVPGLFRPPSPEKPEGQRGPDGGVARSRR